MINAVGSGLDRSVDEWTEAAVICPYILSLKSIGLIPTYFLNIVLK